MVFYTTETIRLDMKLVRSKANYRTCIDSSRLWNHDL